MKALVIGASGLVGGALMRELRTQGCETVGTALSHPAPGLRSLDVTDEAAVARCLDAVAPDVVYVPAALTAVDYCETHREEVYALNVEPLRDLGRRCAQQGARLVHYSTDYVFDGDDGPYAEDDLLHPINVYGQSKADAEQLIVESGAQYLILRTTGVFGWDPTSKNFAMQVWQRLGDGETMRVPSDQYANPTYAPFIAEVSVGLAQAGIGGIVHVAGGKWLPRHEFAHALAQLFERDETLIQPITTDQLAQPARRPLKGGLRTEKLAGLLGRPVPSLGETLAQLQAAKGTITAD
ncbi:MAG: dTDP-4-dehydrorhamnose reductase [Chloroflexota bacterium]|nr:dTDP-4-dehydrorhamnose reductase [Chloroflexota bacterium]